MPLVYPNDFFETENIRYKKATCFVLMPFKSRFNNVYKRIKKTLEADLNIECKRADDFHKPHIIVTILKALKESEYIIADLTKANPNVFYELGIAHCIKDMDKVIIITQDLKYVPFDLQQFRCIVYEQSKFGLQKLKESLIKTFEEDSKNSFRLKLIESQIFSFDNKLSGNENYLYKLKFESPSIGYDGIKLIIDFKRYAADRSVIDLDPQYLFLGINEPTRKIDNIPWSVTLLKINKKSASIALEKKEKDVFQHEHKIEIEATFPGNWAEYLTDNINKEIPVNRDAPPGIYIVRVRFIINKYGGVTNAESLTQHGYGMEEEALRVINNSPKWNPAFQNGKHVNAYRLQPINFIIKE